jgi:DNA repair protein RecO (recombination protein O)
MPIVKTEAFVLKNFNYGDTSKIVTLFTKDHGKLKVIVKGVRSFKSKFCGVFNTMNYINTVIYMKDNKDLYNVSSAEHIRSFKNIPSDLEKLNSAYSIMETLNKSSFEGDTNPLLFDLLFNSFLALDTASGNYINYVLYFQLHLARINGFAPDVEICEKETFKIKNKFKLNGKQISALNYILNNDVNDIGNLFLDAGTIDFLSGFLDEHIADNTDHKGFYKTRKVFKEIKLN